MKKIFTVLSLAIFSLCTYAQESFSPIVDQLFANGKREIQFSFQVNDLSELHTLTNIISIDHLSPQELQNKTIRAYANKKEFQAFLNLGYPYTVLTPATSPLTMMKDGDPLSNMRTFGSYPTYSQYVGYMQQFATNYPNICKLYNLGSTPDGHAIYILKITDNVNTDENEPEFLYTSSMHGDEIAGYPMMLSLIEYLLQNYGTNTRVTNLVNNMEIWINPLANPDGTYMGGDNTVNGAIRYNTNAVDLNRNYPDPQNGPHPDGEVYQAETNIFMGFADTMDFVMAVNFHGGAEVTNYPWDTWNNVHADLNWWTYECVRWADSAQAVSPAGYMDDLYGSSTNPGVTNGYDWYEVNGGRQDYMNWYHHCREMTVELSSIKILPSAQLAAHWDYNRGGLLNFMEQSLYGIRGIITDACTGQPIKANVTINSHDVDNSDVYSSLPVGNYHRPIYPGTYSVTFSATGYQSQTMTGVSVTANNATVINVQLNPLVPAADFSADHTSGCGGTVNFTDLTGSASGWSWNFGDGNTSTLQNPTHTYATGGNYTVTLTATNCSGNDTETKPSYISIFVPTAPLAVNDTATSCAAQAFTLTASGSGTLNWYDAPTGGNLVNTGATFNTPVLSSTTTYYVLDSQTGSPQTVGRDSTQASTQGGLFNGTQSLLFDALDDFILESVYVNAGSAGNRTIELRNSGGTVLQSATINIPAGGSRITLNFSIPAGTGYQLGTSSAANLWRNNAGSVYPYSVAGVVEITGSTATLSSYYYYFYKWKVRQDCASNATPVSAVFNASGTPVNAAISAPVTSFCPGTNVSFTATAGNPGSSPSYQWQVNGVNAGTNSATFNSSTLNNGDLVTCIITSSDTCATGNPSTSNSINVTVYTAPATPTITQNGSMLNSDAGNGNQWYLNGSPVTGATGASFTPTQNGTYYVIVTDGNGCTSDTSNSITLTSVGVQELSLMEVSVYPNPADEMVQLNLKGWNNASISLENMLGEKILIRKNVNSNVQLDVSSLAEGMYLLKVTGPSTKVYRLVVKHRGN